jgi:glycosyltransferase involved in cell wall biosynthesis
MRKKLLFVIPSFMIGGTTVSTLNLISLLDKSRYEVVVMPILCRGILKEQYRDVVQLKPSLIFESLSVASWRQMPGFLNSLFAMAVRFAAKKSWKLKTWLLRVGWKQSLEHEHFDTIVACQEGLATTFVAAAPVVDKVAWVRCEYSRIAARWPHDREFYGRYRSIVCVSEGTHSSFVKIFPEYAQKTVCIPNPQNTEIIRNQGERQENEPRFQLDRTTLVSVGRLNPVKRFNQIAPIARWLKEQGFSFRWYIIGDGKERNVIEKSIKDLGMDECIIMLGAKTNPHYYIKHADLFVCLSESEACPRVVNEAKILGTPTVSTDFPTICEFIEDGKTGIISPLSDIPNAIMRFCNDKVLRERIERNISQFHFDNTELMKRIDLLLG